MSRLNVRIRRRLGAFAIDLAFEAGKGVTGIIGPSGAGKSMTLETLAGLARPDAGRIAFGDEIFVDTEQSIFTPPERRRIGYVFQNPHLFPHISIAENLVYGARRRPSHGVIAQDELIDLLGLGALLDRRPHRLSGGEAQRVAIGRALLSNPQLILMDEPLSSLDPRRRLEIMPFIETLHRRLDLPILYVSHNIDEIVRLADRVLVLHGGKIVAAGEVAEVLNRPEVQNLILGEEDRNADPATIFEARIVRHDEVHHLTELAVGAATLSLAHVDRPAGAAVRLRIHARDVAVATERPKGLSIQNIIEARVAALQPAGAVQIDVTLAIDGAPDLRARITTRAAGQLALRPGATVWALVKSVVLASG
jgi:molybdate transport system ATP-binding protein